MDRKKQTPTESKKSAFGALSVKAGIDQNYNPTQADRIAGATMGDKKSKFRGGGIAYAGGGRAMLRKGGKV
jgi:hypothetical protein